MPKTNEADLQAFLKSLGALDVHGQSAETGWWLGTYSKNIPSLIIQKLFWHNK